MKYNFTNGEQMKSLKAEDFSLSLFMYTFGTYNKEGDVRFRLDEPLILKPGEYYGNTEEIKTSLGNFYMNKAIIPENVFKKCGYVHKRWSAGVWYNYMDRVASALLLDELYPDEALASAECIKLLNNLAFFSYALISVACSGTTENITFMPQNVREYKEKIFKENEEGLKSGDTEIAAMVEKKVLDFAKAELVNDKGSDLFESGSKSTYENNYKLVHVMKGSVFNIGKGKFETAQSSLRDGIKQDEYPLIADAMIKGAYSKGMGPAKGGYMSKKDNAAFQSLVLDIKGSNCGTTGTLNILVTPMLSKMIRFRYMKKNGKVVRLTDDMMAGLIGKSIELYDPMFCKNEKTCNRCAGDLYYNLGITNIGLTLAKKSATLLNKSLKNFHDATIHLHTVNVDDLVL